MAYNMKGHELPGPNQKQSPNKYVSPSSPRGHVQGMKQLAAGILPAAALSMHMMKGVKMEIDSNKSKGALQSEPDPGDKKSPGKFRYQSPAKKFGDGGLFSLGKERDPKTGKKECAPGDAMCGFAKHGKQGGAMVLGLAALQGKGFGRLGDKLSGKSTS